MADAAKLAGSKFAKQLRENVQQLEAIRRDTNDPQDITLAELMLENHQITMENLYEDLGLNPRVDTIQNIVNMPDQSLRWLIPEIFRDALRLGIKKNPIYPNLIAGEQSVKQTQVTMPSINRAEFAPRKVGIAETIMVGDVSFGQKSVKISKLGRGIKMPYEVIQYVSLNLVAIFLQDFGVKLGMGIDALALNALQNGDQADGSDSAPVIGVTTAGTLTFRDLLRLWVRAARMGKQFKTQIAGEDMAIDILELMVSTRLTGTQRAVVDIKTPIPTSSDLYVHGLIATNKVLMIDPTSSLIKLNAQPLLVESEKIISNQTEQTFATITTGFATIFRDSRLILDKSLAFASNGFPAYLDPTVMETVTFD